MLVDVQGHADSLRLQIGSVFESLNIVDIQNGADNILDIVENVQNHADSIVDLIDEVQMRADQMKHNFDTVYGSLNQLKITAYEETIKEHIENLYETINDSVDRSTAKNIKNIQA